MKKAKIWLQEKGLKHIGLVIAAIVLWIFFPSIFNWMGLILLGVFIGLNWQPLKDLSDIDEKIENKFNELKKEIDKIKSKTGAY